MDSAKEVRKGEELDWKSLEEYLKKAVPTIEGRMTISQFHGGHANLTYLLGFGNKEYVLRRPPFGKIAPGAHDMRREYRVLSKLYAEFPQAPRAYHYCKDESIIGAPFVLLERKTGVVVRTKVIDCFKDIEKIEERLTNAIIKAQAKLHLVDYEKIGLSELGKPDGFLKRQISGWSKRWELSKSKVDPSMNTIKDWLNESLPKTQTTSLIHNDIKPDNCQFQPDNPDIVTAIFDWDMCTLGDPLVDFGTTLTYFPKRQKQIKHIIPLALIGNWPERQFIINQYQKYTGFDLSRISWYEVFSYWKGAIVLQQLYKRYLDGATHDKRMKHFGTLADSMIHTAKDIIDQDS